MYNKVYESNDEPSNNHSKIYVCEVCGHTHDESVDGKLEDLPAFANCPECGSDAREVYKEF